MNTTGHLKGSSIRESQPRVRMTLVEECRESPIEQHDTLNECHISKSSPRSPNGPSHHGTEHEEGEEDQKKKKNQNLEEDSSLE